MSTRATEKVLEYARENGLSVFFPKENELQLDLDNWSAEKEFRRRLGFFKAIHHGLIESVRYTHSRTGGKHAYITLTRPVKDAAERLMLQAMLGSDAKREILSYKDLLEEQREPTLFFEKEVPACRPLDPIERVVKRVRKAWNSGKRRLPDTGSTGRFTRTEGY